jgi:hypothetical protein
MDERQKGELVTTASAIADALEEAEPLIVKLVEDAERFEHERRAQAAIEERCTRAGGRSGRGRELPEVAAAGGGRCRYR